MQETLSTNPPIHTYINKINKLVVKIKYWYNVEIDTPETVMLFGSKNT